MSVEPVKFITVGTKLQLKYISLEEFTFYDATVTKIIEAGDNYVTCQIEFDNQHEDEDEITLYNSDFANDKSEDTWMFKANEISLIVKSLVTTNNTIKDIIDNRDPNESWIYVASKLILNVTLAAFFGIYTYKIAQNHDFV